MAVPDGSSVAGQVGLRSRLMAEFAAAWPGEKLIVSFEMEPRLGDRGLACYVEPSPAGYS
jgi:hypothetical protein